jgi:outer membrane protein assembly factor BamB
MSSHVTLPPAWTAFLRAATTVLLFFLLLSCVAGTSAADDNWPQFRGHGGLGIGSGKPPTRWDVKTGENIVWKSALPGLGHSAPIIWGDRVFLTTAVSVETDTPSVKTGWSGGAGESAKDSGEWSWRLLCLDITTGKILWNSVAHVGEPTISRHLKASHANCTPATDGTRVLAFFGSEGLHCFDFKGRRIWKHDFGKLHSGPYDAPELEWGFASSPVIHDGRVIVQCDCLNANFVAVLDLETGKEIRRIDRKGEVATWSTPLVVTSDDNSQIVCNGYRQMAGYDFETGNELWRISDGGDVPVPTPLFANGLIYITNSHSRSPTFAVRPTARGDLTPVDDEPNQPGLAWWQPRDGSYMPTPLVLGELLYACNDNGRLTVRDALTGELVYRKRVGRGGDTHSASAVAAGASIYFSSERGRVTVIQEGRRFKQLASNEMGEIIMATPAISANRLFIRTARSLYCISDKRAPADPPTARSR